MKIFLPFIGLFVMLFSQSCKQTDKVAEYPEPVESKYKYDICIDSLDIEKHIIEQGQHPSGIFIQLGFTAAQADHMGKVLADVLPPTKIRAGMHYTTFSTQDTVHAIKYIAFAQSYTDYAILDMSTDSIKAYPFSKPISVKREYTEGTLRSSLWNVIKDKGIDPLLALQMSDVYAWQIDFFDLKKGDSFKVMYDVRYIDDTTALDIAKIVAIEFIHQDKKYTALSFSQDSTDQYFDFEGKSLQTAFLKAPLDFFRITSTFSNARFHPVLKYYRAHHGVDYAAPSGTPVKTIGDGTVVFKAYQANGGGNYLKIQHNSTYTTSYMHLSRFAKGIARGSKVKQGEVIGYVGSTGLSTGPHLDFRVYKDGKPIDPLKMVSPPSHPVKAELRDSFNIVKDRIVHDLDIMSIEYKKTEANKL